MLFPFLFRGHPLFLCAIPPMYSFFMPGLCSSIYCSPSPSPSSTDTRSFVPSIVPPVRPPPLPPPLHSRRHLFAPLSYNTNKHNNSRPTLHAYSFAAFPTPLASPITYSYLSVPPPASIPSSLCDFVYYSSVVNAVHLLHDITSPCNLWSFFGSQTVQITPVAFFIVFDELCRLN